MCVSAQCVSVYLAFLAWYNVQSVACVWVCCRFLILVLSLLRFVFVLLFCLVFERCALFVAIITATKPIDRYDYNCHSMEFIKKFLNCLKMNENEQCYRNYMIRWFSVHSAHTHSSAWYLLERTPRKPLKKLNHFWNLFAVVFKEIKFNEIMIQYKLSRTTDKLTRWENTFCLTMNVPATMCDPNTNRAIYMFA